eukprot:1076964-Pyramimonas_sp.AAC.1
MNSRTPARWRTAAIVTSHRGARGCPGATRLSDCVLSCISTLRSDGLRCPGGFRPFTSVASAFAGSRVGRQWGKLAGA